MSTDAFLDMLAPTVQRTMPQPQRRINEAMAAAAKTPPPPYRAPTNNSPAKLPEVPKATLESELAAIVSTIRPDYADDIDAMVATLVSSGDVVFDTVTDQYRRPYSRRYRFGSQS